MNIQENGPTRFVISRLFQMLREVDHLVPRAWRLRMEAELRGMKEGFIARNGIHPKMRKRAIMEEVVEHYDRKHKDRKAILNMITAAHMQNLLPGLNTDLQVLRNKMVRDDYDLTVYDHELIDQVINVPARS